MTNATFERQSPPIDLPDNSVQTLVCDIDAISRIGLGVVLNRQKWVARCFLAAECDEAAALARRHKPDVAIVDVSKAGPYVASYIAPLQSAHPEMRVLLSSRCGSASKISLPPLGAVGMLPSRFSAEDVVSMVRTALVGGDSPVYEEQPEFGELSERERQVLALMSTGATNREIAAIMHLGAETVKKHAGSLYRKLGVRNRTEAAQRAAELLAA